MRFKILAVAAAVAASATLALADGATSHSSTYAPLTGSDSAGGIGFVGVVAQVEDDMGGQLTCLYEAVADGDSEGWGSTDGAGDQIINWQQAEYTNLETSPLNMQARARSWSWGAGEATAQNGAQIAWSGVVKVTKCQVLLNGAVLAEETTGLDSQSEWLAASLANPSDAYTAQKPSVGYLNAFEAHSLQPGETLTMFVETLQSESWSGSLPPQPDPVPNEPARWTLDIELFLESKAEVDV